MRIARKLMLLCAMAIAAMAFAATNASALEPVTVVEEDADGGACNPCEVHVVGESSLAAFHVVLISNCSDEFLAQIGPTGAGEVSLWEGEDHHVTGNPCTRVQCEGEHWPFDMEEVGANEVQLNVEFCLSPEGDHATRTRCDVPVHVTEEAVSHHYLFDLSAECLVNGTPVEVHGEWETEEPHRGADQEFEIVHQ